MTAQPHNGAMNNAAALGAAKHDAATQARDTDPPGRVPGTGSPIPQNTPVLEARSLSKFFGRVIALKDISMCLHQGEVVALLGDNGAGKSTLIKCLSGVHAPDAGTLLLHGVPVRFKEPRDALRHGIATVYQDLAMIPQLGVARNFVLGAEPTKGWGLWRRLDLRAAERTTREGLLRLGIDLRDASESVGTLSGGERQSVAIARALHFGARVLILDEPTSALGVRESERVLQDIDGARQKGVGVILITHNVHHAYPVADIFTILKRGRSYGTFAKDEVTREQVLSMMAGL